MTKQVSTYNYNDHIPFKDGRVAIVDEVHDKFVICYIGQERMLFTQEQLDRLAGEPERWE